MTMSGSCLCGAVRYEITGAFKFLGNCHCSMCRKAHGAAFVTWGIVDPDQFHWVAGKEFVHGYESSPGNRRCFCKQCGAPLVSTHSGRVGEVVVGTLDGDPGLRPSEHIFVGSKASWHEITDGLPQHAEWPPEVGA
ncbi:Glutathione-dependent formaldehyde-activating enzyme [compost metagenome]